MKSNKLRRGLVSCLLAFAFSAAAWGDAFGLSTTGDVQLGTLAGSLVPGAQEDQLEAKILQEQGGLTLGSDLAVDASVGGVYNSAAALTPSVISAGTVFSDWYFHSDAVISSGTRFSGSITFTQNILGVISQSSSLAATDGLLGQASVVYATTDHSRGMELGTAADQFSISNDLRTLTFSVMTYGNVDDMRILTGSSLSPGAAFQNFQAVTATPEPDTFLILGIGLAGVFLFRKKCSAKA